MINSISTSATNLITQAKSKASEAAHSIATLPVVDEETGLTGFGSEDLVKPVFDLLEAEIETSAAAKLLKTDKEIIRSLFDATA